MFQNWQYYNACQWRRCDSEVFGMSAKQRSDGPTCGCIGCRDDATLVVTHPRHGKRIVCEDHQQDFEVIRRV